MPVGIAPPGDVQVFIEIEIEKIDTLEQSYFANLSFTLRSSDGNQATHQMIQPWPGDETGPEGNSKLEDKVWYPQIAAWNEFESTESEFRVNQVSSGVRVLRTSRSMSGNYFMQFDDFPFDKQTLEFCLMLDPGPRYDLKGVCVYDLETEFEIVDIKDAHLPQGQLGAFPKSESAITLDMFKITIQVKRHALFYLLNFFSVTFALVLLQCISVGVDIDDLPNRLQITLTLILTLSAHKISVAGQVPKNTKQTTLDLQAMWAFLFLGAAAVESLLISFEIVENSVMEVMDVNFNFVFAVLWITLNIYLIFYKRSASRQRKAARQPFAYFGHSGRVDHPQDKHLTYRRVREDPRVGSRTMWVRTETEGDTSHSDALAFESQSLSTRYDTFS